MYNSQIFWPMTTDSDTEKRTALNNGVGDSWISSGHISLRTIEWEIMKQLSTTPLNCPQKPNMAL